MATLMAGPRTLAHEHLDKLAITLFGAGRPLLGGPSYPSYGDPARPTLLATPSQSTLSVDGRAHSPGAATWEFLAEEGTATSLDSAVLQARDELYPGVTRRRALVFGADRHAILVLDQVDSAVPHDLAVHERLMGEPAATTTAATGLDLAWPQPQPAGLRIEREARTPAGTGPLQVRWRPPQAVSSLRAAHAVVATVLSLSGARTSLRWRPDGLDWHGPRGIWHLRLPLAGPADARFEPVR